MTTKTPQQRKLSILYQEYDANLTHLNKLRKMNAWNPLQDRLIEQGHYVLWHRNLMMQIFQVHFEIINAQKQCH